VHCRFSLKYAQRLFQSFNGGILVKRSVHTTPAKSGGEFPVLRRFGLSSLRRVDESGTTDSEK
jgi:hypothetical protein